MKIFFLTATLLLSGLAAQAHTTIYADQYVEINKRYVLNQQSDCVTEYITPQSERTRLAKSCHIDQPLRLSWVIQDYPNLRENPRRVQYWEGSASKVVATDRTYLRELVDTCHGRVISRSTLSDTSAQTETFAVRNPNLDASVSESFMLVPMTNSEASSEMAEALHRCSVN